MIIRLPAMCLLGLFAADDALAGGVYQEPMSFVQETFAGKPPAPRLLWLTKDVQARVRAILGHDYPALRARYWMQGARSAWVLDEIGKEEPITAGIVIDGGKIETVKVLIFRESRGDEVRYPAFTRQFKSATLTSGLTLDKPIDGISGATLSVRALTKLARLALYFDDAARRETH